MKDKEVSVHRIRSRGDSREMAAQLAPLEELQRSNKTDEINSSQVVAQENGAIVVGVEQPELARVEVEAQKRALGLEPVVLVIVGLMLAFIAFIAWQISQMPQN